MVSESRLRHGDLTERIIRCFYAVYNALGPGFVESVYERALLIELAREGLRAESQVALMVYYRDQVVGEFRADVVVEGKIILELKAVRAIEPAFDSQVLNYLKATRIEVGLLLNFGPKPEFRRFYNDPNLKHDPYHPYNP